MSIRRIIISALVVSIIGLVVYWFYPGPKLPANVNVDKILVLKSKRQLMLFSDGKILKTYRISLGRNPVGAKEFQGDKKTPEGIYYIDGKNPNSRYHKNLGISYPGTKDIEHAKKIGKSPGGDIKIHGHRYGSGFIGKYINKYPWTLGCIALTNSDVDEIYSIVKVGTSIEIRP